MKGRKFSGISIAVFALGGFLSAMQFLLSFVEAELAHGQTLIAFFCMLGVPVLIASFVMMLINARRLPFFLVIELLAITAFGFYAIKDSCSRYEIDFLRRQIIILWIIWGITILSLVYGIVIYFRNRKN